MYFISIAAIILVTIIVCFTGNTSIADFMDLSSLAIILLLCIPILISAGLFKDFNNAFRIALHKGKEYSLIEIRRALEAVSLVIKTLLYSGIFLSAVSLIVLLRRLSEPAEIGPNLSVAILTWIYTLAIAMILLPIKSILNIRIIEFMPEHTEHTENALSEESE